MRPHEHSLRRVLDAETHARPSVPVHVPARVWHLVMLNDADPEASVKFVAVKAGVPLAETPSRHALMQTPEGLLKWERHGEFTTWTFYSETEATRAPTWWAAIPGEHIVAMALQIMRAGEAVVLPQTLGDELTGARVGGGLADIYSSFHIEEDGYVQVRIDAHRDDPARLGRLVGRILEIETYRMMALLALPLVQSSSSELAAVDKEVQACFDQLADVEGVDAEAALLRRLTGLAETLERIRAHSSFRLRAASAYAALFEKRLDELREERLDGLRRPSVFLNRRFAPAMATCTSFAASSKATAARIEGASALLRTRVEIDLERQNATLLASMNARAEMQLRTQRAVEGLSVFAISYYVLGLMDRPLTALEAFVPWLASPATHAGIALGILLLVWLSTALLQRRGHKDH